ncbi:MAG: dihydrodipicolinate reductase [Planctomycetota bacterium]|nr:dihydrodipicolinate reductase [Planctomycetota bacterium]
MKTAPRAPWNVLFVGMGPLGRIILTDYVARSLGSVAGIVDTDPRLSGQRARDVVPGAGDLTVQPSIESALARTDPQSLTAAVVATSSDLAQCVPTFRELLGRGMTVVSTCEELLWPWLRHAAAAEELDQLARARGGRLVGTGVNPGFLMDTLPVALTAVARSVRRVRVERYQDASTRRVPFQKKIGAALTDAEFEARVAAGTLRHVGLGESMHFIAHAMGLSIARWNETIAPVRAPRALSSALGSIPAGGISGVRQTSHAFDPSGQEVITLEFQAAIGQDSPRDRVIIEGAPGDPVIDSTIAGAVQGDIATSAITLNAIASLRQCPPGLHTMATMPLTRFVR